LAIQRVHKIDRSFPTVDYCCGELGVAARIPGVKAWQTKIAITDSGRKESAEKQRGRPAFSTRPKSGWPGRCSCWPILEKKADRSRLSRISTKKLSPSDRHDAVARGSQFE
jgi:hypothetical protein